MGITQRSIVRRGAADDRADPHYRHPELAHAPGDAGILVSVARSFFERRAAAALVESRYASRGYRVAGDRVPGCSSAGAAELTLLAAAAGAAVGTLTLRLDGPGGLRAEETYRDVIDAARAVGRRVCELGRFAVASEARSTPVLAALFTRAHLLVRDASGITSVFIEVNPRHAGFYRRLFGFAVAARGRMCPRVLAPSVLLRLEVAAFERRLGESSRHAAAWTRRLVTSSDCGSPLGAPRGYRPAAG